MSEQRNILSLFDGISCGRVALNKAGIQYNNYYASEINKNAIKVTNYNYPDTIQLGDVTKIKGESLPKIWLLIGGSPCTSFSSAGKHEGFDGKSKLFWEFARLLKEVKPTYFLLENVRMKMEWSDVIDNELGVKSICIDSSLVSAQSRKRLYWTNIPNITQPEDKKIQLKDILEDFQIGDEVFGAAKRTYPRQPTGLPREKRLENRKDKKLNCLTTHPWDSVLSKREVKKLGDSTKVLDFKGFKTDNSKSRIIKNIRGFEEKVNCLTASNTAGCGCSNFVYKFESGYYWRNITRLEAERAQTLPEGYTSILPDTTAKKAIGNGWTVDVITHIFKGLK